MRWTSAITCAFAVVVGITLTGCLPASEPAGLTAAQAEAVAGALAALEGFVSAVQASQAAALFEEEGELPTLRELIRAGFTFGDCPEITLTGGDGAASILIDFGTGCSPVWAPDLTCAGSLLGSFDIDAKEMSLALADYTCGATSVEGDLELGWDLASGSVTLSGATDLTVVGVVEDAVTYDGSGSLTYTSATATTMVTAYDGALTVGDDAWTLALAETPVSYRTYENLVPFGGAATLTGLAVGDTIEVFFDSASPETGAVQVSINGGRRFEWTLPGF